MKIDDDGRKCVVFLGHGNEGPEGSEPSENHFRAVATGFFVRYKRCTYLITARHVAEEFGDAPFQVRVNTKNGSSCLFHFDYLSDPMDKWWMHEDPTVDIAAVIFPFDLQGGEMDQLAISEHMLANEQRREQLGIGTGDICYAIGLFRLMQGMKRNLPIVHSGSIAALPSDELIPTRDSSNKLVHVNGYLVEMTNLRGLSGSPVLVRSTINAISDLAKIEGNNVTHAGSRALISAANRDLYLLGVWASSWEAKPEDVLAIEHGQETRVPVGLGTVIPTQRLLEILDLPYANEQREEIFKKWALGPDATPDLGDADT